MTILRFSLYSLVILLTLVLAAGYYTYRQLPDIIAAQLRATLGDYGVHTVHVLEPELGTQHIAIEKLNLEGNSDGRPFEGVIESLSIRYNWRTVLTGRALTIEVGRLALKTGESAQASPESSGILDLDTFKISDLLELIPADSLKISRFELTYATPIDTIKAKGALLIDRQLDLTVSASYLGAQLTADLATQKGNKLTLDLQATDRALAMLTLTAQLEQSRTQEWHWQLEGALQYDSLLHWLRESATPLISTQFSPELADQLREFDAVGDANFSAALSHGREINLGAGNLSEILTQLQITLDTRLAIEFLHYPGAVENVTGNISMTLATKTNGLSLAIAPTTLDMIVPAGLTGMTTQTQEWLGWGKEVPLSLTTEEPATIDWQATTGALSFQVGALSAKLGGFHSNVRLEGLNFAASYDATDAPTLELQASSTLRTRLRKQTLIPLQLDLKMAGPLAANALTLTLADTAQSLQASLEGKLDTLTGAGNFTLRARTLDLPYATSSITPLLDKFDLLPIAVELTGGSFVLASNIQSAQYSLEKLQQQAQLDINNLSGSIDEYSFKGLSLAGKWQGVETWQTTAPLRISLASLDAGFTMRNTQATLSLPRPTAPASPNIFIEAFSSEMFGGQVYMLDSTQWDFSAPSNAMLLRAENWQLRQLVALQQGQDIQAQGVLEGELPVVYADGRLVINNGFLRAIPPGGSIRYVPNDSSEALAASNEQLALAIDLLKDFQYEVLSSDVALDKEGILLFGLKLSGKNPRQFEGRKINFNINLEQNIDPLLQSLRLDDKLIEHLEKRAR